MDQVKVGGETSAYCTSCRDMRHHVVVAMVGREPARVECLSCHKQHNYKAGPPGARAKSKGEGPSAARKPRPRAPAEQPEAGEHPLDALLAVRSPGEARAYVPSDHYEIGDLVNHPSFGLGAVSATPGPGKIEVIFRDACRLLMHERPPAGTASAPRLQPPPRREDTQPMGASDAPPKR